MGFVLDFHVSIYHITFFCELFYRDKQISCVPCIFVPVTICFCRCFLILLV